MNIRTISTALFGAAAILISFPAIAHHSISGEYFLDQRTTVEGELVQFLYRNPHSFVEVKAKDPQTGNMVTWSVEWNGAGRLGRDKINADTLKPGDHIVVTGQPSRTADDHRLHMVNISRSSDGWKWSRNRQTY